MPAHTHQPCCLRRRRRRRRRRLCRRHAHELTGGPRPARRHRLAHAHSLRCARRGYLYGLTNPIYLLGDPVRRDHLLREPPSSPPFYAAVSPRGAARAGVLAAARGARAAGARRRASWSPQPANRLLSERRACTPASGAEESRRRHTRREGAEQRRGCGRDQATS